MEMKLNALKTQLIDLIQSLKGVDAGKLRPILKELKKPTTSIPNNKQGLRQIAFFLEKCLFPALSIPPKPNQILIEKFFEANQFKPEIRHRKRSK